MSPSVRVPPSPVQVCCVQTPEILPWELQTLPEASSPASLHPSVLGCGATCSEPPPTRAPLGTHRMLLALGRGHREASGMNIHRSTLLERHPPPPPTPHDMPCPATEAFLKVLNWGKGPRDRGCHPHSPTPTLPVGTHRLRVLKPGHVGVVIHGGVRVGGKRAAPGAGAARRQGR